MADADSPLEWLRILSPECTPQVDGLMLVSSYDAAGRPPEEVAMIERARNYGAHAVFFEAGRHGRPPVAQAFVFLSTGPAEDAAFAQLHKRLWSWGGVPLVYRKSPGLVQLFRCAHKPDFVSSDGVLICKPVKTLKLASDIAATEAWWDAARLRNGTLWDDPAVCDLMLSSTKSAHRRLVDAVRKLNKDLGSEHLLSASLRRRLLILSLLIAYLEERKVLLPDFFARHLPGAQRFFEVLGDGAALVAMLGDLEERFNGHVFSLTSAERDSLATSPHLGRFARLVEGREESDGQLTFWRLYSFRDLPVELISHIYQLFVSDVDSSVYTPPALVRLILEEALSWERLDRLVERGEVILDPACGSGVFLVEAYKRLVLHWRSRHQWRRPEVKDLRDLLMHVHGVDLERGAVELAAFSLCLVLCDALEPEEIRASVRLFPGLDGVTIHHSCFFAAKEQGLLASRIGVVVGNPPFVSKLSTPGARRSAEKYEERHGPLPDQQLAYLFLHEAMELVAEGGILSMLQQYGFLYNQKSAQFRDVFLDSWNVREILDFVSVRGLFQKGGADTKVIVVVAEARPPTSDSKVLHAVFRRNGRAEAEQGFDIDYYDLHWMPRSLVLHNPVAWRANLLGGGRVYGFAERLMRYPTFADHAERNGWEYGEGFIEGANGVSNRADHIIGKHVLPPNALLGDGVDESRIGIMPSKAIEGPRTPALFTPPYLAVRKHSDLGHAVWAGHYMTFKSEIVGFAAVDGKRAGLDEVASFLKREAVALRAFTAVTSTRMFTRKATALSGADIKALPYPETGDLDLSENEAILAEDIVLYQRDLVRLGNDAQVLRQRADAALGAFAGCFAAQIETVYPDVLLRPLAPQFWPGVICLPFVFGEGRVDWSDAAELQGKIDVLLHEQRGTSLSITRIARIYDDRFLFLLKPDRLRYWLRSVALRDADETLSDLRMQGL